MADLLKVADLEAAKKHDTFHTEVITGKVNGVDADYATNAVTGQVQKTLPATVNGIDWTPIGNLTTDDCTFTKSTDYAVDENGTQWAYNGTFPFTSTAPVVPSSPDYYVVHVRSHSALPDRNAVGAHDAIYRRQTTVAEIESGAFSAGDKLTVSDRDDANFDVVAGGVSTGYGVLDAGNGNAAVLQVSSKTTLLQAGAAGDGSTNDDGAVSYLETFSGFTFDLLGKTYAVTDLPKNNEYINGRFKVGINIYPQRYVKGFGYNKSQFNLKRDYSDSRYTADVVPALRQSTVLLGDSISHGAYQGNLYADGYANLLKRMFNAENGNSANGSYGLIPLLSWNTAPNNNTVDVHQVIFTDSPTAIFTKNGECLLNSLAYECTGTQAVKTTIPTFQTTCRIWYVQDPTYGTLEVFVNGVSVTTVDTSGAFDLAANITVPITDDGFGSCTIEVKASVGTIAFSGFGYEQSGNVFNNFSQSGRKLSDLTEGCIKKLATASNLIVALGHNDVGVVDGNPANEAIFSANIDLIIKWATYYNTNVIVPDFCWFTDFDSSHVRQELKRLSRETSGTYVPIPEYLTRDLRNRNEFGVTFYLVNTLKMFHDGSHPNELGAQWIAETIASEIGLGCNTKSEAMDFHDFWMPLQLDPAVIKNRFTSVPNLTAVRKNGNSYQYNIRLAKLTSGSLPVGVYDVNIAGGLKIPTSANNLKFGTATLNQADGTIVSKFYLQQSGAIKLFVDVAYLNTIDFSFEHVWK